MSIKRTLDVMERSQSKGPARAVLLVLAFRENKKGVAWPSVPRLAKDVGLTVRTVQRAITALERLGEITVKRDARRVKTRGGKQPVNVYTVNIPTF